MRQLTFFAPVIAMLMISCSPISKKDAELQIAANTATTQHMSEDKFWELIDKSIMESNNNYQVQVVSLKQILAGLAPAEIIQFNNTFNALMGAAYDYKLWGAAYVINGGCSDDDFEYFRQYLVAHGKDKFYQTLKDPESCASWMKTEEDDNWEGILYAAAGAYKIKTGQEMPKIDQPKYELKGQAFDEDTVEQQYPVLAKKFEDE